MSSFLLKKKHMREALLFCFNLDDTQSQKMLAEQLGVSQAAISMRLHAMGKVQKIGKWVHELNDKQTERRQNTCQILLARQKRKSFLHRIVTSDEKWIYFQNPKERNLLSSD